ncbi:hypothetical protein F8M41_007934 [Gigaspora margarita]|uniref:Uncharacterized protein n=1 Tax=Gigaspora margarita TaxID=4874 RepID=A0A8H4A303_GIGMA|nr:hypothetical protein F8M41_007934 [Gigaspora margarita]
MNKLNIENSSCLFTSLVESYHYTKQLVECETKEKQRIRNASTDLIKNNNDPILNKDQVESKVNIGIQVNVDNDYNLSVQIDALKSSLANVVTDYAEQLQAIQNKNYKILELEHERESLKKQVDRNYVIVKFIETLTDNDDEQINQNKIFKRIVAVDTIYKSRHSKYVSEINLAASAIKYSIARSKLIIDIDNHITGGGGYTKFLNWIESLAIEPKPLPDGFLILAFDNEQKGQKNYLD